MVYWSCFSTRSYSGGHATSNGSLPYNDDAFMVRFGPTATRTRHNSNVRRTRSSALVSTPKDPKSASKSLQVEEIDFRKSENGEKHRTSDYEKDGLIVRRGQEFSIVLHLNRKFDEENDKLQLQLAIGNKPKESKGTLILLKESEASEDAKAWTQTSTVKNDQVTFKVRSSCEAIVGEYDIFVNIGHTDENGSHARNRQKLDGSVIVLFNPWCQYDQVYMENEDELNEYILNDHGCVYVGSVRRQVPRPWNFGQFDDPCLEAALFLLKSGNLQPQACSNPVLVTRALSAMVNSCDEDQGVLQGNWSGKYQGGRSPTVWGGSVAILEEFMAKRRTVKFGQCWVFSGLCTTLGRALGIPTRSVTNFASAHDTDCSMTIDNYVDEMGKPMQDSDSVWNFHVWNESFFKRPDLPEGCNGWQAFDATPQEASEGVMRCGPAPVNQIKEGQVHLGYDAKFIFAEVNADSITWRVDSDGYANPVKIVPNSIGKFISTKKPGTNERLDLTHDYKHHEGSTEERNAISKATMFAANKEMIDSIYNLQKKYEIDFKFDGLMDTNGDLNVKLTSTSSCEDQRAIMIKMYATAAYYTGVPGEELGNKSVELSMEPNTVRDTTWVLKASDYITKLDADANVRVYVYAHVKETPQYYPQFYSSYENFEIDKPDVIIELDQTTVQVGEEITAKILFTNPLDIRLHNSKMVIEGAGLTKPKDLKIKRVVAPKETIEDKIVIKPRLSGLREIIATFTSDSMSGITGSASIMIKKR